MGRWLLMDKGWGVVVVVDYAWSFSLPPNAADELRGMSDCMQSFGPGSACPAWYESLFLLVFVSFVVGKW